MPIRNFGTIMDQRPMVKRLTLEAECDNDVSYTQLEKIIGKMKKDFKDAECKISLCGNVRVTITQWEKPVKKNLFEQYISG